VCLLSLPNADHMSSAKSRTDHVKPTDKQDLIAPVFQGYFQVSIRHSGSIYSSISGTAQI
jgi:hypothetical protein